MQTLSDWTTDRLLVRRMEIIEEMSLYEDEGKEIPWELTDAMDDVTTALMERGVF